MKTLTKALAKGTLATVAAGAMVLGASSPAAAQDRHRDRDDDGISAGEVIAGAVVLGGLAAIIASSDNDDDRYYDRRYDDRRYDDRRYDDRRYRDRDYRGDWNGYDGYGRNSSRRAIEQCVNAAERAAQRYSGSRAEVYEIRNVDRERRGYEISGRIAVRDGYRDRDWGWGDYRRGHRNDGWDEGRFECEYRHGRVVDVDFDGLRGL